MLGQAGRRARIALAAAAMATKLAALTSSGWLWAQRRQPRGQQRPDGKARVARGFDDAGRLGHAPRASHRRHERELGRLAERVGRSQQRREREDHG
jgi:hypothetical protein